VSATTDGLKSEELPPASDPTTPLIGIELFFGLVGPTGTNLDSVIKELGDQLRTVGYGCEVINLSDLILEYTNQKEPKKSEYERIRFLMREGTKLCEDTQHGDFVARLGVLDLSRRRRDLTKKRYAQAERTAWVFRSLKRKKEVELLRSTYGKAFTLISVYSSLADRVSVLSRRLAKRPKSRPKSVEHQALELIHIDAEEEGKPLGQGVRNTFPLADYFVTGNDSAKLRGQLARLTQLTFANEDLSPTRDEYSMFMAQAAALRSASLSRQVGACIVSEEGELLASGCNEAPKFGGGMYWFDDPVPARDVDIRRDMSDEIRQEIVEEFLEKLKDAGWIEESKSKLDSEELYEIAVLGKDPTGCLIPGKDPLGFLEDSQVLDVIEYGRSVHAEMAAITDAAKRGISLEGSRLFCTTFPCHLCARHIVSTGIRQVIYIEPYPKSRTEELFFDSVVVDPKEPAAEKVNFRPFVGVAPRRYLDFFQHSSERKNDRGELIAWTTEGRSPRVKRFVLAYLMIEDAIIGKIPKRQSNNATTKE
jgi:cytidine deaminase